MIIFTKKYKFKWYSKMLPKTDPFCCQNRGVPKMEHAKNGVPQYSLLKKDAKFKFGEEEFEAFNFLKNRLISSPILATYDPHAETQLHCDASSYGFRAILLQKNKNDNKFHPVSYFSRKTDDLESKLHSFELETLAVVYAIKSFHIHLAGIHFEIFTDCNALVQTLSKKER